MRHGMRTLSESRSVSTKLDGRKCWDAAGAYELYIAPLYTFTHSFTRAQHYIRVLVHPPSNIADHVPRFEYEIGIELATDTWDSPEREVATIGGTPRPALKFDSSALDRAGSSSTAIPCARGTYMGVR